ncbi:MAG TPA: type 1 glutamine amidotransferase domain-containing protein [Cellvibrio sp.]|nr:type 1 glutamine amidotransferase domain-containing protein [Cellvibrio sp.]
MNRFYRLISTAVLLTAASIAQAANVLVVLSDTDTLELKAGKTFSTGFYLNEAMQPVKMLREAGHSITFATPTGRAPTLDKGSINPMFFGGDTQALQQHLDLLNSLAVTSPTQSPVISLTRVAQIGYEQFDAVFVPGGHAPMQDLLVSSELGKLLGEFHRRGKPTALVCHGPIALLSTLPNANEFTAALARSNKAAAPQWIYAGYRMTVFSNAEEEASKAQLNGGEMKFYPQTALEQAGAKFQAKDLWQANVVEDRELITGQNPASAIGVGEKLLARLAQVK